MHPVTAVLLLAVGAGVGLFSGAALTVLGLTLAKWAVDAYILARFDAYMAKVRETQVTPLDPRTARDVSEAEMFDLVVMRERLEEGIARRQHVLNGGRVDDSPTKWAKKGKP